jgi:hypothetical protein
VLAPARNQIAACYPCRVAPSSSVKLVRSAADSAEQRRCGSGTALRSRSSSKKTAAPECGCDAARQCCSDAAARECGGGRRTGVRLRRNCALAASLSRRQDCDVASRLRWRNLQNFDGVLGKNAVAWTGRVHPGPSPGPLQGQPMATHPKRPPPPPLSAPPHPPRPRLRRRAPLVRPPSLRAA